MSDKARISLLAGLVTVLALIWWFGGRTPEVKAQRSFREHLLQVDTAALNSFTIVPPPSRNAPALHFQRDSAAWTASTGTYSTHAFFRTLNLLLADLVDLRPVRSAGSDSSTIGRYGLNDSTAARLELPSVGPRGTTLLVGATTGGGGSPSRPTESTTAVMLAGDPNVYLVQGSIKWVTDRSFSDWIPKPMVNGDPANWEEITFVFPGRISYSIERSPTGWTVNGKPGDRQKVDKYLGALSRYYSNELADPADTLNAVLVYSMRVIDTSRKEPVILGVFQVGGHLIARSTLAPSWLVVPFDPQEELPRLFRPPDAFLPAEQAQGQ